jgi:hypothetical protein
VIMPAEAVPKETNNMTTYKIANESNRIISYTSEQDAEVISGAERFRSEADLAKLAASWPMARLIEIWNNLPGVSPVQKFQDRKTAITRIWRALHTTAISAPVPTPPEIEVAPVTGTSPAVETEPEPEQQTMFAPEAAQSRDVAPANAPSTEKATRRKKSPTVATNANGSTKRGKTAMVCELMQRVGGVTARELMSVTGWQAHSVRGFISGTLGKKMGLTVVSTKAENGERTYSISQ